MRGLSIRGRALRQLAAAVLSRKLGLARTVVRELPPAMIFLTFVCCKQVVRRRVVRLWAGVRVTIPVSTGLQPVAIVLLVMKLALIWTFGRVLMLKACRALAPGRQLPVGLLVQSCILTVRLAVATRLRCNGKGLFRVIWTRYRIRLRLATVLAMGRLIRSWAPTLRKKNLLLVITNLIALVLIHLTLSVRSIVVEATRLCRLLATFGDGDLLIIPRRWCRTEYLCLNRRIMPLRALLNIRILIRCVRLRQCLMNMALLLKESVVLCPVVVTVLLRLLGWLICCTFPLLLLVEVPISIGNPLALSASRGMLVSLVNLPVLIPNVTV